MLRKNGSNVETPWPCASVLHFASGVSAVQQKDMEVKMSRKRNLPYVSDHTLNKDEPYAIVYRVADGNLIRLTEADFASRGGKGRFTPNSCTSYIKNSSTDSIDPR